MASKRDNPGPIVRAPRRRAHEVHGLKWTCSLCKETAITGLELSSDEDLADYPVGWAHVIDQDVCASCIDHLVETRKRGA